MVSTVGGFARPRLDRSSPNYNAIVVRASRLAPVGGHDFDTDGAYPVIFR